MRLDQHLPEYDVSVVRCRVVDAPPAVTFDAIRRTDITSDPIARVLGEVRDVPNHLARWRRGEAPAPRRAITFGDLTSEEFGWVELDVVPGHELVAGLAGRFWERDYGMVSLTADEWDHYDEPGTARTAVSFLALPYGERRTLLVYESRTLCVDEEAQRAFGRYWRLIGPFAAVLMDRGLKMVADQAERDAEAAHLDPVDDLVLDDAVIG